MKRTVSILVFLTGTAAAGKITLQPLPPAKPAPTLVATEALCKVADVRIRAQRTKFAGREVAVLHQCGASDLMTELAFETTDGDWHIYPSATIAYRGANMTDAPLHVMLLSETVTTTKVAGTRVLLHRVDTLRREIRQSDGTIASESRESRIDICRTAADGSPECGYAQVECPETGCKAPEIIKGALWLHAKGGRQRFPIDSSK